MPDIIAYEAVNRMFNQKCFPDAIGKRYRTRDEAGDVMVRPIIRCCGENMLCDRRTNTCDHCGTDYSEEGYPLAPRSQWGEETGEHWSECY